MTHRLRPALVTALLQCQNKQKRTHTHLRDSQSSPISPKSSSKIVYRQDVSQGPPLTAALHAAADTKPTTAQAKCEKVSGIPP